MLPRFVYTRGAHPSRTLPLAVALLIDNVHHFKITYRARANGKLKVLSVKPEQLHLPAHMVAGVDPGFSKGVGGEDSRYLTAGIQILRKPALGT